MITGGNCAPLTNPTRWSRADCVCARGLVFEFCRALVDSDIGRARIIGARVSVADSNDRLCPRDRRRNHH